MMWGEPERCQKSALEGKPKAGQARLWRAGKGTLGAQNAPRARARDGSLSLRKLIIPTHPD